MLMVLWRYLLAPLLYPIFSAPLMIIGFIAKPLQVILVLVTWGLYSLHVAAGAAFVAVAGAYYIYGVLVPPSPRSPRLYMQWASTYGTSGAGGQLGQIVFTVGMMVGFLLALIYLPDFNSVARWFAALGLAYYCAGVAMGFVVTLTTPSLEEQMRRLADGE